MPPSNPTTIHVLPEGKDISSSGSEDLLSLLTRNGILLRNDCGGQGTCGKCMVYLIDATGKKTAVKACLIEAKQDMVIEIPSASRMLPHLIDKAPIIFPQRFLGQKAIAHPESSHGIAIDLGTTTIALHLVDLQTNQVRSSITVKNPQALHGADVVSRIGYIGNDSAKLDEMQQLVSGALAWGMSRLFENCHLVPQKIPSVVVGNPSMIHILLGISPASIGVSPYQPAFFAAQKRTGKELSPSLQQLELATLPLISGFLGADILAAAVGCDLASQQEGTLLIDLGTNGELILKGRDRFIATSCATGPAFEGANLSCGILAVPGAIDSISIDTDGQPRFTLISAQRHGQDNRAAENTPAPPAPAISTIPTGICGSGILSGTAALLKAGIINQTGAFVKNHTSPCLRLAPQEKKGKRFVLHGADSPQEVAISQKDIRAIQLGKAALITGIEFLLKEAGLQKPAKIIIAGAFGCHQNPRDLLDLHMIPQIDEKCIEIAGNGAGTGAIMALCDEAFAREAAEIADTTQVINLADNLQFQAAFVTNLSF